jgi:hypothetical protein
MKFSSLNFSLEMDLLPVALWYMKSPPWHISCNCSVKAETLTSKFFLSSAQSTRELSTIFGTLFTNSLKDGSRACREQNIKDHSGGVDHGWWKVTIGDSNICRNSLFFTSLLALE